MEIDDLHDRLIQGVAELNHRWTYDDQRLKDAVIELGVSLELYEADLNKESQAHQNAYYSASPREQFCQFIHAMDLPELKGEEDSALIGLTLTDLELVWLAIHAESLACFCAAQDSSDHSEEVLRSAIASALQIEMVLLHADRPRTTLQ